MKTRLISIIIFVVVVLTVGLSIKDVKSQGFEATLMPPKVFLDLERGQTVVKKFDIRNESEEKITFYLQKSDLDAEEGTGSPKFIDKIQGDSYSMSQWMKFDVSELSLNKGQTGSVNVTIKVPSDAEPGGHYGAVWFSTIPPNIDGTSGVAIGANYVGQILANVNGDIYRDVEVLEFKSDKKIYKSLPVNFSLKIQNKGNTHFEPVGRLRIRNRLTKKEYNLQINQKGFVVLPQRTRVFDEKWIENPDDKELIPKIGLYDVEYRLAGDIPYVTNNNIRRSFWVIPPKLVIGLAIIIVVLILIFKLYGSFVVKRSKKASKKKTN